MPDYGPRGIAGDHLRTPEAENADGNEQTEKPLPTQVHTRRGSAARTALTYTPLATGDAEHELARSRAVFFPLRACRFRGIDGYHLRNRQPQAETAGNSDAGHAAGRARARSCTAKRSKAGNGGNRREWPLVKAKSRDRRFLNAGLPPSGHARGRAVQSALREHQGSHAEGANKPSAWAFRNLRRSAARFTTALTATCGKFAAWSEAGAGSEEKYEGRRTERDPLVALDFAFLGNGYAAAGYRVPSSGQTTAAPSRFRTARSSGPTAFHKVKISASACGCKSFCNASGPHMQQGQVGGQCACDRDILAVIINLVDGEALLHRQLGTLALLRPGRGIRQ